MTNWRSRLLNIVCTMLGLIVAFSPLALWAAPTLEVLVAIIAAVGTAGVLVWLLSDFGFVDEPVSASSAAPPPVRLSTEEFIAQLERMPPVAFQHRRFVDPAIAKAEGDAATGTATRAPAGKSRIRD